jgi:hypothetical protein
MNDGEMRWRWFDTLAFVVCIIAFSLGLIAALVLTCPWWVPRWIKTGKVSP